MLCRWRNARCISSFAPPTKESMSGSFRKIPIEVAPAKPAAEQEVVSLYAAQKKIYPRSVHGRFNNWRVVFVVLTQLVFLGLPGCAGTGGRRLILIWWNASSTCWA
jgi:hypothetical protein